MRQLTGILKQFRQQWARALLLVLLAGLAPLMLVLPILRHLVGMILRAGDVPVLAPGSALLILLHRPLVICGLLLVVFVFVVLASAQLLFLCAALTTRRDDTFSAAVHRGWRQARRVPWGLLPLLVTAALLFIPLSGLIFAGSLIAKLRLPLFLAWWLGLRPLLAAGVFGLYLLCYWLGIRCLGALANVLQGMNASTALRKSWRQTRGHFWSSSLTALSLLLVIAAVSYAWTGLIAGVQHLFDGTAQAFGVAVFLASLLFLGKMLIHAAACVLFILLLVNPLATHKPVLVPQSRTSRRELVVLGIVSLGLTLVPLTVAMRTYQFNPRPLTIAHRGVDGNNGVQNTIAALQRTAVHHPDYVEMDVHETKDQQFVVLHDENLRKLAGVDKTPRELTLWQLQQLPIRENGRQGKLASFDDYLKVAARQHQKLIVELKTTPADSREMLTHFARRYGRRLQAQGDRVHSLDYVTIAALKRRLPQLDASFVLGGSVVFPRTKLNAYSMGTPLLDTVFTTQAHAHGQAVWAWTVNTRADMVQMMFAGSDAIVTDHLSQLQAVMRRQQRHPAYAQWLVLLSDSGDDLYLGGMAE
jgi:glycerophosphoryl diester phosphodiesterase